MNIDHRDLALEDLASEHVYLEAKLGAALRNAIVYREMLQIALSTVTTQARALAQTKQRLKDMLGMDHEDR